MAITDPIKEIVDDFENKIFLLKKEREESLINFKGVIKQKKIEDIKSDLKTNAVSKLKK